MDEEKNTAPEPKTEQPQNQFSDGHEPAEIAADASPPTRDVTLPFQRRLLAEEDAPPVKQHLGLLVSQWLAANDDEPDPWLLTPEDEEQIIEFHLNRKRRHYAWRLAQAGFSVETSLQKIAEIDWLATIDRKAILEQANRNKNHELFQFKQREKELEAMRQQQQIARAERADIEARWTYKRFFSMLNWTSKNVYGKELICDQYTLPMIKALCYFLSRDKKFETELGYSFDKGLWMQGQPGKGKTFLLQCLQDNERSPISMHNMKAIARTVKGTGEYLIPEAKNQIICVDDVGAESTIVYDRRSAEVNHFGTRINWFSEFIQLYYIDHLSTGFGNLIVTTNESNFDVIDELYGNRVRSRLRQMFNILDVKGPDLR